jgi:hypothetical protein
MTSLGVLTLKPSLKSIDDLLLVWPLIFFVSFPGITFIPVLQFCNNSFYKNHTIKKDVIDVFHLRSDLSYISRSTNMRCVF